MAEASKPPKAPAKLVDEKKRLYRFWASSRRYHMPESGLAMPGSAKVYTPLTEEIKASWKHARLKHAQEEARCQQTRVVLHETLAHRNDAKAHHTSRERLQQSAHTAGMPKSLGRPIIFWATGASTKCCWGSQKRRTARRTWSELILVSQGYGWGACRNFKKSSKLVGGDQPVLYWVPVRFRSAVREKDFAFAMLTRSKKANRYSTQIKGIRCRSMHDTMRRSVVCGGHTT
jgi:hypothetical protein